MTIASLLADAASLHPDRVGIEDGSVRWTYSDAADHAASLAADLARRGIARGDVVAWLGDNTAAAALAYFGAAWAGAILAPLHLRLRDEDLLRVLDHAGAQAVLVDETHRARAAALARPVIALAPGTRGGAGPRPAPAGVRASDPAHLYYTSGSTGTPKGVVLTHGNVTSHARHAAAALGLSASDVWLHAAPMFHLADAWATFAVTLVGGTHRFVPRFDAVAVLDAFERGVTATNLVPTMWSALVRDPSAAGRDFRSLRLLLSGGAAVSPDLVRRIRAAFHGAEYAQTYGLTETSPYLTISRLSSEERALPLPEDEACRRLARAGRPMPGVEVRVVGPDGCDVPPDDASVGEVVARGETVTPGYFRNPEADRAAFRDGWFRTGDLARVDAAGRIDLVDRTSDVINTGGEKVFSVEVERALADLEGVREVAVVGAPDAHWGEVVVAVVVPEGAAGAALRLDAVRAHARARLADFKVPRRLVVLREGDALPRTASGKVAKVGVRGLAREASG